MTVKQGAIEEGSARSKSEKMTDAAADEIEEEEAADVSGKESRRAMQAIACLVTTGSISASHNVERS